MVSLRNGKSVKNHTPQNAKSSESNGNGNGNGNGSPKIVLGEQQSTESRKRKAPEEDTEEMSPPSTPKTQAQASRLSPEPKAEPKEYVKTPGRVGPIKPEKFVRPDIKPFKGPPGKKVRKTAYEKDEEYKQFARENEGHTFHELYVCFDKGPNGSPTYDKSGFELDYEKVVDWMTPRPYNKGAIVRGMERHLEKSASESRRMAEIFFEKGEAPASDPDCAQGKDYWKDRVSKDLNIPWHKIGVEQFEEWERRGFKKARKGEYEEFSKSERDRMMTLLSGASLRK